MAMTPLSEYRMCQTAFRFYWKMDTDTWYRLDDVALQQTSWGAKIDMTPEEREILLQVGKWIIGYNMLDSQEMELTFSNDYTRVKKNPWVPNMGDSLYRRQKLKLSKNVPVKK